jgi:hypothetical protein
MAQKVSRDPDGRDPRVGVAAVHRARICPRLEEDATVSGRSMAASKSAPA